MMWAWSFEGIGTGQYRVHGVTIIKVNEAKQVYYQQVEFNSAFEPLTKNNRPWPVVAQTPLLAWSGLADFS